jgi:formiminotetrahydrofolate cyclodeaminase
MELIKQSIQNFSDLLASTMPTPGGGSSAALEGALGSSLIMMVAGITMTKAAYMLRKEEMQNIVIEADSLRRYFLNLVDEDTAAYNQIMAARSTPEAVQKQAVQDALKAGVIVPFQILNAALQGLDLAKRISEDYYLHTASDLGLAVQSLKTAAQGADLTILINLRGITDTVFVYAYKQKTQQMLDKVNTLADVLYAEVRDYLTGGIE